MLYIQLLASFFIAGLFIAMQTLIAERVPLRWRGVALTIPSTMAIGLLFIGIIKSPLDAANATIMAPVGIGATFVFATVFAFLSRFGLAKAMLGAQAVWFLLGITMLKFPPQNFAEAFFLYALPLIVISYFFVRTLPRVHELKIFPMNAKHITVRSIIGGSIVLFAVLLSKILGNFWGGLFATFPALFTSTFIIYYHLQGKAVIPAIAQSIFFPGSLGLILYGWIVALTFPTLGVWLGTLAAYAATFAFFWLYNRLYAIMST